jgi:hypothetical protein
LTFYISIARAEGSDLAGVRLEAVAQNAAYIVAEQMQRDGWLLAGSGDAVNIAGGGN